MSLNFFNKFLITTAIAGIAFSAQAQFIKDPSAALPPEVQSQERTLKNVAAINGLLVGYGFYCKIPNENVEKVHNHFYYLNQALRNKAHQDLMIKEYEEKIQIAREKGPSYSSTDCNSLKEEYNKILAEISKNPSVGGNKPNSQ